MTRVARANQFRIECTQHSFKEPIDAETRKLAPGRISANQSARFITRADPCSISHRSNKDTVFYRKF